ncbi:hypothetical protein EVAR_74220_1 [Eumeta japonica]|uniref:Uncharacterized protein n=1 Tax=Eumeta variegata TaxID=151549 RepID=A0A4C1SCP7_EUMVA|nr:hypothetical protein EVAR_74220_1 [Eumeta japonica]
MSGRHLIDSARRQLHAVTVYSASAATVGWVHTSKTHSQVGTYVVDASAEYSQNEKAPLLRAAVASSRRDFGVLARQVSVRSLRRVALVLRCAVWIGV